FGSVQLSPPVNGFVTTCEVATKTDDPFPTGTLSPSDTQALCGIKLSDFGASLHPALINVCSYPSASPNSDAADCILKTACTVNNDCNNGDPCTTGTCSSN